MYMHVCICVVYIYVRLYMALCIDALRHVIFSVESANSLIAPIFMTGPRDFLLMPRRIHALAVSLSLWWTTYPGGAVKSKMEDKKLECINC